MSLWVEQQLKIWLKYHRQVLYLVVLLKRCASLLIFLWEGFWGWTCQAKYKSSVFCMSVLPSVDLGTELSTRILIVVSWLCKICNRSTIMTSTNIRIYEATMLWLLHGAEVYNTTKKHEQCSWVFHQFFLRRILKKKLYFHVSSEGRRSHQKTRQ
jgi:hypothetical protein